MAYLVAYYCDKCNKIGNTWDTTRSLSRAKSIAKSHGWEIREKEWICPECIKNTARKECESK